MKIQTFVYNVNKSTMTDVTFEVKKDNGVAPFERTLVLKGGDFFHYFDLDELEKIIQLIK